MISEHVEPVDFIIQGKGEIPDIPRLQAVVDRETLCPRDVRKITQVFDNRVPNNEIRLVPLKRVLKGVRICQKTDNGDDENMGLSACQLSSFPACCWPELLLAGLPAGLFACQAVRL